MLFKAHASVSDALARLHIPVFPAPSPLLDAFGGSAPDAPMALPTLLCLLLATCAQRCCVVLCSGVANTCTCRFAIFATSCTGSIGSSFPLGSTCAMPCITTSTLWSRVDSQKLSSTFRLALAASKRRLATLCLLCRDLSEGVLNAG